MQEIWKDIIIEKNGVLYDYTGLYQVSNLGRVYNSKKGRLMKLTKNNKGYLVVALSKNGKQKSFYIHRLVATAFIPNPNNLPCINHKSEIKTENHVTNLEWCDITYNNNFGTRTEKARKATKGRELLKMTGSNNPRAKKVRCVETGEVFDTIKDAQEWLGIKTGICECCKGKLEKAGGYHWRYVD